MDPSQCTNDASLKWNSEIFWRELCAEMAKLSERANWVRVLLSTSVTTVQILSARGAAGELCERNKHQCRLVFCTQGHRVGDNNTTWIRHFLKGTDKGTIRILGSFRSISKYLIYQCKISLFSLNQHLLFHPIFNIHQFSIFFPFLVVSLSFLFFFSLATFTVSSSSVFTLAWKVVCKTLLTWSLFITVWTKSLSFHHPQVPSLSMILLFLYLVEA